LTLFIAGALHLICYPDQLLNNRYIHDYQDQKHDSSQYDGCRSCTGSCTGCRAKVWMFPYPLLTLASRAKDEEHGFFGCRACGDVGRQPLGSEKRPCSMCNHRYGVVSPDRCPHCRSPRHAAPARDIRSRPAGARHDSGTGHPAHQPAGLVRATARLRRAATDERAGRGCDIACRVPLRVAALLGSGLSVAALIVDSARARPQPELA